MYVIENRILQEQLLQEAFLDSVKDYAKEKYSKAITTINDWKDLAVVMGKVISDPTTLNRFADDVWRNFKVNTLKKLTALLERMGLNDLITKIKSVVDKITNLDGWKKFLAAAGIGAMVNYVVEKMAGLAPDAVKVFLQKYVSEKGLGEILSKLTDFKSYVGWLQPIIKGVDMLYDVLKSSINKFKSQANLFTQQINLIKKENMLPKDKIKERLTTKLKQEMSMTGTGASVTPGVGAGVATKYAFGKTNKTKPSGWKDAPSIPNRPSKAMDYKELWEEINEDSSTDEILTYLQAAKQNGTLSPDAQEVLLQWMNTPGASREEIIKVLRKLTGMYLKEGYAQFRNSTKQRSKPDQFHQAVKQVKQKMNEINRIFEYVDRLKSELSEGEDLKYKKYTENAFQQIKESAKQLFLKSTKLK
jgi:archaellum component FlaC